MGNLRAVRRLAIGVVMFAILGALPAPAAAQYCVGSGTFNGSPVHVGADLTLAENTTGVHGSIGFGGKVPFGGVAVAAVRDRDVDEGVSGLVFFGGAEVGGGRVFACPIVDVEFTKGPNVGDVDVKGVGVAGGGRIGFVLNEGSVRVIPTFGYFQSRVETTVTQNGVETSDSRTFGVLQFGVGFVGRHVSFGPLVLVPVGLDDADTQLRLGVGFHF